jgi:Ca-activated chloride channel family protein
MELDEIKYLYLLLYYHYWCYFSILLESKKQSEFGDLELIKKLSPDRSVFKPIFKLVVIL